MCVCILDFRSVDLGFFFFFFFWVNEENVLVSKYNMGCGHVMV